MGAARTVAGVVIGVGLVSTLVLPGRRTARTADAFLRTFHSSLNEARGDDRQGRR
ncbi:hypothetical protein ACIQ6Y_04910 [Streptomyces sp. NPDC096205]|uniref:hypothetical protein n=1 Tax=Streptomyces sp. NPDC096205 TaxID=3366081 RepID=UPI0037F9ED66